MPYVMGIDIGTYESKGVIVDRAGQIIAKASITHELEIPKRGWAEHDAEKVWWHDFTYLSNVLIDEVSQKYGIQSSEIKAVGASSIAPAVIPIDAHGKPLRKAILYGIDTRTEAEIEQLTKEIGDQRILRMAGHHLSSQSAGPKILWIRNHEPEVYQQTYKFLSGSGYIVYKLCREYVMDRYTAASFSPLFHLHKLVWNPEVVEYITELDKLPRLVWGYETVGEVTRESSMETGLSPGTKVIAGTADALSESISVGAVHHGDLMLMYGSSTFFILVSDNLPESEVFWPSIHAIPGLKTVTGGTATAGSITRWFAENWMDLSLNEEAFSKKRLDQIYSLLAQEAQKSPPGSNGLLTLPFFSGERTPIHDPNAKGVQFGLTLQHKKQDLYRSILEGIAYSIRHNLDEMRKLNLDIHRVVAVGGGVKNRLWLQSVSDICEVNQVIPSITIGASYGDAFLCALGLGWYKSIEEVDQWVHMDHMVEADATNLPLYRKFYSLYLQLYEKTKELMKEI